MTAQFIAELEAENRRLKRALRTALYGMLGGTMLSAEFLDGEIERIARHDNYLIGSGNAATRELYRAMSHDSETP